MKLKLLIILSLILITGCVSEQEPVDRLTTIPVDAVKITPEMDNHPPILHSNDYEEPVSLAVISSAGAEDSAFYDDNRLFFFFTPDPNIPAQLQLTDGATGIYVSEYNNGWQEAERIILNNDLSLDGCEYVNGDIMWFCTVRANNLREIDLYTAEYKNGKWTNWKNAGENINLEVGAGEMHIHEDIMYFHAENEGNYDIFYTELVNDVWQAPISLDIVNTEETEGWPFITDNGNELWFTRTYLGTPAVYRSIKDGEWQEPELIISQFAGEPTLDEEGNIYFTHHFYEDGVMLEADIYIAYKK